MIGHKRVKTEHINISDIEVELVLWENQLVGPTPFSWAWYATLGGERCGRAFGLTMPVMRDFQEGATEKVRQDAEDDVRNEIAAFKKIGRVVPPLDPLRAP